MMRSWLIAVGYTGRFDLQQKFIIITIVIIILYNAQKMYTHSLLGQVKRYCLNIILYIPMYRLYAYNMIASRVALCNVPKTVSVLNDFYFNFIIFPRLSINN